MAYSQKEFHKQGFMVSFIKIPSVRYPFIHLPNCSFQCLFFLPDAECANLSPWFCTSWFSASSCNTSTASSCSTSTASSCSTRTASSCSTRTASDICSGCSTRHGCSCLHWPNAGTADATGIGGRIPAYDVPWTNCYEWYCMLATDRPVLLIYYNAEKMADCIMIWCILDHFTFYTQKFRYKIDNLVAWQR